MEIIFNIDNRQVSVFAFDSCLNKIKKGDRIAQGVVFEVEGSGQYSGSYQEEE